MAEFAVRFYGEKRSGWHGGMERAQALRLPGQMADLARERLHTPGLPAPADHDRWGRACIAHVLRDGARGWDAPREQLEIIVAWWLIWSHGDRQIQAAAGVEDLAFEVRRGSQPMSPAVRVKIGETAFRDIPERPLGLGEGETFAPLAAGIMQTLTMPERISLFSEDVIEILTRDRLFFSRWDAATRRRLLNPSFLRMRASLHRAIKMVFDRPFSHLVTETAEHNPARLLDVLASSRLPFEHLWLEWDRAGSTMDNHGLPQWGALVEPCPGIDEQYRATIVMGNTMAGGAAAAGITAGASILAGSLLMNFRGPVTGPAYTLDLGVPADARWRLIMGPVYGSHWPRRFLPALRELASHAEVSLDSLPYGDLIHRVAREYVDPRDDNPVTRYFGTMAVLIGNCFRELMCGMALVATHIGGESMVSETVTYAPRRYYGGKYHPPLEYRVMSLRRPMTAPRLLRHFRPRTRSGPVREHPVIGHFVHECIPNAQCQIHPRACPIAVWQAIEKKRRKKKEDKPPPDDGRHDQQICLLCRRKRHYRRDHKRGDPKHGILEKGYQVTASARS